MRIFDSDGNDFLDFKEFLLAMDIATCETEESKLVWAFKLFDNDNSGYLDVSLNFKTILLIILLHYLPIPGDLDGRYHGDP